ncbi:MAG: hypothetical protein LAQ30_20965 [Acidobacteriia bacterium]|nr:hypothetical protein [Terriglobia bacterium]
MDILAHALWTTAAGAAARRKLHTPVHRGWAVFWGVFPDLFAFTIPAAVRIWWRLSGVTSSLLPQPGGPRFQYVWQLYNASHSAILFGVVFGLVYLLARRPVWPLLGWGLHIFLDSFTHAGLFATHFLWPASSFAFDGIPWENRWCLAANYGALALAWLAYRLRPSVKY